MESTVPNEDQNVEACIVALARHAAKGLSSASDDWGFQSAAEFEVAIEPHFTRAPVELRVCLASITFLIRNVMQNLGGDVPYEPLGERLDVARANVQRSLRLCFESLATDLHDGHHLQATIDACGSAIGEYFSTVERLNRVSDSRKQRSV